MSLREWADKQIVSERELRDALESPRALASITRTITRASSGAHPIIVPNGREWEIVSLTMIGAAAGGHRIFMTVRDDQGAEVFYVQSNVINVADTTNVAVNGDNYQYEDAAISMTYIGFKLPFERLLSNWTLTLTYTGGGAGTLEGVIKEHW